MGRPEEFLTKAAEFEALAAREKNDDVRDTHKDTSNYDRFRAC
jgi:hypothetical protein